MYPLIPRIADWQNQLCMKGYPGIEPLPLRYRSASSITLMLGAPRIQSWAEMSAGAYIYPATGY